MKRWISIKQAKEIVSLSRPTLVNLILSGDLRGRKVGKKWLIDQDSIQEFMEGSDSQVDLIVQRVLSR